VDLTSFSSPFYPNFTAVSFSSKHLPHTLAAAALSFSGCNPGTSPGLASPGSGFGSRIRRESPTCFFVGLSMSRAVHCVFLTLTALALTLVPAQAQLGVTNSTKNPKQIALLHWYDANLTTAFSVARSQGMLVEGPNLWITTANNTVIKMRTSDGAVLGTFPVGTGPLGLAFDGANIWVANINSHNIMKLRASDGAVLGTFGLGTGGPSALAFDGANIWTTNTNFLYRRNEIPGQRRSAARNFYCGSTFHSHTLRRIKRLGGNYERHCGH
jgi:DNA-binding beta-propeller fold protein YncE